MENSKVKILAIDDNQDNLISLKALISEAFPGLTTLLALSGTSGLELAKTEDPDVVLLDIVMPGMDGYEVCRKLKADRSLSIIPVIFITALKGDRESRIRALEAGAEAFLAKPVDPSELTAQIKAMVKIKAANVQKSTETQRLAKLVEMRTHDLTLANEATLRILDELKKENEARKKSEAELLQANETYLNIFNSVNEAIYIQDPDTGAFIDVNQGAEKMYGKSRDEIVGQTPFTIAAPEMNDLEYIWQKSKEVFETGKPAQFDFWALRNNGEAFPKEVIVNKGKYFGKDVLIATARDISEKVRSEETIKRNYAYNRALLDANPDVMFVFDKTCTFVDFHAQSFENVYVSPDVFLGKKPEDVLPPDVAKSTREKVEYILKTGNSEFNTYSLEINGETKFYESRGVPLGDDKVLAFVRDITERKKAEELLSENQSFLDLILQTVPDPVTVVRLSDNVCLKINLEFTRLLGWTADEAVGRTYKDFNLWENPDDRMKLIEGLKQNGSVDSLEARFNTKNKTIITGLISARLLTLKGEQCLVTITRDITERKRVEESLVKSEERNRLLSEVTMEGILIHKSGIVQDLNPALVKMIGYEFDEIINRNILEAIHPDDHATVRQFMLKEFSGPYELRIVKKSGEVFFAEIESRNFQYQNESWRVSAIRDITERKKHEELLRQSEERARLHKSTIASLIVDDAVASADIPVAFNRITEMLCSTVNVQRASIWLLNTDGSQLICKSLFDVIKGTHSEGLILLTDEFPDYFEALRFDNIICATNALTDPATRQLSNYLQQEGVFAMLDTGIQIEGELIGVVCLEQMNQERNWHPDEQSFANTIAALVGQIVSNSRRKEAEENARKIGNHYRALIEKAPDGIVLINKEGIIFYASPSARRMFGYSEVEEVDTNPARLTYPDDLPLVLNEINKVVENPSYIPTVTYRFVDVQQKWHWVESTFTNLYNHPDVNAIVINFRDITDRMQAEEELRESEERFRALHNASFGGITIHDKGKIIECNQGLTELTGYSQTELIGMDGLLLIASHEREYVMENIKRGYEKPYESVGIRKNGEEYPLRLEARNIPYKGKMVRTVEFRDITEQKRAEAALVESEKKYRQLVGSIHETLTVIDKDGNFLFANEKAAINLSGTNIIDNVVAKNIRNFIPALQAEAQINRYRSVIEKQELLQEEVFVTFQRGSKWFINTLQPILFGADNIPAVMSTSLDITDRKKAEIELQEKQHFINKIAENSPNIIYLFDVNQNRNIYTNRSVSATLGYSPIEMTDEDPDFFNKLIHPEDLVQFNAFYQNIGAWPEQKVFEYEYRMKAKTGEWRWFKGREKEFQRVDGKVITMIGSVQDITAAKIAENAIAENEEKFRLLITQMEQGMAVHEAIMDESGEMADYRFIDVNESFERITGLRRAVVLGKTVLEMLPGTEKYWIEAYGRVVKTGKSLHFENYSAELGRYYEVVAYRNRVNQFAVIITDITSRKISEITQQIQYNIAGNVLVAASLADLMQTVRIELGKLLDTTNFLVALYDSQNDEFHKLIYQDEKDDFTTWKAENSLSGQVVRKRKTLLLNRAAIEKLAEKENLHLLGSPAACWLGVPIMTHSKVYGVMVLQSYTNSQAYHAGNATLLEMVAHEISIFIERQQLIEDLTAAKLKAEENDRLKSAFLANMSHEIRTPMNGILGFTDLLKDEDASFEEQQKYIEVIEKSGQRLLNLINDLIDISKIEAGQVNVLFSEVDVHEEAKILHSFFMPEANKKSLGFSLQMQPIPHGKQLITDKDKFLSVITNLIKNALKFTDSGEITFGYAPAGSDVRFFVRDTGRGIPHDKLQMIFDRFGQADVSLTRNYEGAGLGLSIAKAYVEMMGGEIGVNSQEGEGSEFYFTLPLTESQKITSYPGAAIPDEQHQDSVHAKIKVLVAEDDEFSVKYFSIKLKDIASEIYYTKTGTETVDFVRNHPDIQLVLMDIKMPGMDGLDATRLIRQFNKSVIIIAQTAYALTGDREKSLNAGCNDYMSKPINKEVLIRLIERYF